MMKKGFTLAEVLITLAVIGVVAALTIPTLVHKYQQKELYTQFMKVYNTFSKVYVQLKADGLIDVDNQSQSMNTDDILDKLKYNLKCDSYDPKCFENGFIYYPYLKGGTLIAFIDYIPLYSLQDGVDFQITSHGWGNYTFKKISIDTNGINKGPNVVGRDFFEFYFIPYQQGVGFDSSNYTNDSVDNFLYNNSNNTVTLIMRDLPGLIEYCNPTTSESWDQGAGCAGRLLLENKMNY